MLTPPEENSDGLSLLVEANIPELDISENTIHCHLNPTTLKHLSRDRLLLNHRRFEQATI